MTLEQDIERLDREIKILSYAQKNYKLNQPERHKIMKLEVNKERRRNQLALEIYKQGSIVEEEL